MGEELEVKIWRIPTNIGIKVIATIENVEDRKINCDGCGCPCCYLSPILNGEEFSSEKFIFTLLDSFGEIKENFPEVQYVAAVPTDPQTGECFYFDSQNKRCRVWETRPAVCRAYDCKMSEMEIKSIG